MSHEEIDIVAETQVKHTESRKKIAKAISNLFGSGGEMRSEEDRVVFLSAKIDSLQLLKDQFRDRRIRAAARRLLLSSMDNGGMQAVLLLNKQAATVGIAALCDDPSESPLGPIVLRIRSPNLRGVIDWLTKGYDSAETS
ncbi:MAG TPA: RNA-binding domain-containing protein [Nitrososphaerales archaeon]|nr:RNA-binding domain-containing protein [Nitrososphaerales archaeon]